MNLPDSVQQQLQRLLRTGMDTGLARLTQISGAPWQVSGLSLSHGPAQDLRRPAAGGPQHCAALFTMPGGVFLVAFPEESAAAVARAFFKGFSKKPDAWKGKEPDAVAEIANMVVNPAVNLLGDAALMIIFLSSPEVWRGDMSMLDETAFGKLLLREDGAAVRAEIGIVSPELPASGTVIMLMNSALAEHLAEALGA
ncbi:MAG: hypothetical protein HY926_15285 [Elusimicrobia bacterium]|nr:hypothetical protein [Elusimicrobiota bacterium]